MQAKFDLHIHTRKSDGTRSPAEQVRLAAEKGLKGIAITDHDTIEGWAEALEAGEEYGIEVVPGVEISSVWEGRDVHILGYYVNGEDRRFLEALQELRNVRSRRNAMILEKLNQMGIPIAMEEVAARKKGEGGNIGRPHIAEVLMEKGIVSSLEEAFQVYLGTGGKAYVNPPRITPFEAIELIRSAGGVPVLAHPGLYGLDHLIPEMAAKGLAGIEAYHADHLPEDERKYEDIGRQFNLILTGGSDYHGERNGKVFHAPLGSKGVSQETVRKLKERAGLL